MSDATSLWNQQVPDLAPYARGRATVRQFDPEGEIPDEELKEIVDAGRKAPTSGTTQAYSFVWVRSPERRERIHELCAKGTDQVETASHFLVVCIDARRNMQLLEHRDRPFALPDRMGLLEGTIDATLAAQLMMVVAESRGYGVCPIGNILNNIAGVAKELELPAGVLPIFGLCIGIPVEDAPKENCPRVPLDAVLHEETYSDLSPSELDACYERMDAMYGDSVYGGDSTTWDETLFRYWGPEGFMNRREDELRETLHEQGFGTLQNGVAEDKQETTADSEQDTKADRERETTADSEQETTTDNERDST